MYIGVTLLGWPENEVWKMTPHKLVRLFQVHREFHPEKFGGIQPKGEVDIDIALGGL